LCSTFRIDSLSAPFLLSREVIDLGLSVKFNPREGAIDAHGLMISLKIGDCSAKVDLLNRLLDKLLPRKAQNTPLLDLSISPPAPVDGDTPQPSAAYTFASQLTPAFPSPAHSFASSLFSPSSLFSSSGLMSPKDGLLSPKSTHPLSPRSHKSPSSPFFQAISVSI
jgi:hypothetical protein